MLWKINNWPTPVPTPKITFTTQSLNTIYGHGRRLFHNANLFICIKKKMRDGWFGGRRAHWGTYLEEDNKFPHTKMVSGGGAHFDRNLWVYQNNFVEQFKPGKVVPSCFSDVAAAAAVQLILMREFVTAGWPAWWEGEIVRQNSADFSKSVPHQGPKGMRNFPITINVF